VTAGQYACGIVAHGAAYAGYLKTVGETIVNKDAAGQGKYLGLVLQPPEGGGEYQTVVVALKLRAMFCEVGVPVGMAESLGGYEALPLHGVHGEVGVRS
jgi:hypothetical protein